MKKTETAIPGVYLIEPDVFGDHRGWFMESWSYEKLKKLGIDAHFVQDNHSFTAKKDTLRGLHFQIDPMAQAKLVRCTAGAVLDVAVDLRKGSPTYKKWVSVILSAANKLQLFIPRGFAHGFLTLTDNVEFEYKCDNPYSKEHDRSIRFDDPEIGVDWKIADPILSEKDRNAPFLKDSDCNFIYAE
ncbi:MAG TPA: dTDP-4-dehydrorhamnose 3,5-epimerase [Bacillota bacterium]|nr:dTDP-4-dehydrorhamnose 3,5-epimerase [Bacillota bacterium]HOK68090.1 dTDP-4-dehydrorhamnose 3,5-epimerase [Bacillota bacterium]HPP84391.1 dTDP-4-dehydrorhamnose 3,5-epimerase [Bacillota bacterium]